MVIWTRRYCWQTARILACMSCIEHGSHKRHDEVAFVCVTNYTQSCCSIKYILKPWLVLVNIQWGHSRLLHIHNFQEPLCIRSERLAALVLALILLSTQWFFTCLLITFDKTNQLYNRISIDYTSWGKKSCIAADGKAILHHCHKVLM